MSDGGSKVLACQTAALVGSVSCNSMGLIQSVMTHCWSHILRTALSKFIGPGAKHDHDLSMIDFRDVKKRLQSCINFTKKSGKGSNARRRACAAVELPNGKLYTPVKTHFGSVLLMLGRLSKYRKAVEATYSQSETPELRKRNPSIFA